MDSSNINMIICIDTVALLYEYTYQYEHDNMDININMTLW